MNPELRRNFWIELTPVRLIIVPLALALFFVFFASGEEKEHAETIFTVAYYIVMIAAATWGARKAADALSVELRQRTWDQQRLSGLSPFALAVGKIFGAPSLAWYVILCCVAVQILALLVGAEPSIDAPADLLNAPLSWRVLALEISVAYAVFAISFFAALLAQSGQDRPRAFDATLFQICGVVAALMVGRALQDVSDLRFDFNHDTVWWGVSAPLDLMQSVFLLVFGGWALFGATHRLRAAFALPTTTLPWILFLVFLAVFFAGLPVGPDSLPNVAIALLLSAYAAALLEPHRVLSYRFWMRELAARPLRGMINGPAWLYAWIGAAIVTVAMAAGLDLAVLNPPVREDVFSRALITPDSMMLAAVCVFALRDLGLCVWVGLRAPDGRGLWGAALGLALLWGVAPSLSEALFGTSQMFSPETEYSLISGAAQTVVAWFLAASMFKA